MIIRYALFEGEVRDGQTEAFREAVTTELLPLWKQFPGASAVRLSFSESRDDGAPEFPLILAVSYPSQEAMQGALASPIRMESRRVTESVVARFFDGRIHHHVTMASDHAL
ncbi:hypothetical protein [Devosia sp.]|uniref:hypothetical protein n=1 Tax=Devosia sp. TaxID=1871048 RepID=UPI00292E4621|nr:hypothetical protein [Devosia sp.]